MLLELMAVVVAGAGWLIWLRGEPGDTLSTDRRRDRERSA